MTKSIMKILMWIMISIGLLAGSAYGAFYFINNWEVKNVTVPAEDKAEDVNPTELRVKDVVDPQSESVTDAEVEHLLHGMTHQKVVANEKWTFTLMSSKNIKSTIEIVEKNKDHLTHYDFYMEALKKWEQGDFSNCVEVHNQVWEWEGGNIGKATRLATAEEEKAYLGSEN
ncbi:DUF6241 domain-containing protein [Ectobacillus funiculus]|uniref:DUF6241 domain-containing protein n=1 Tax=Ectobacillus funiculus TaxID=137993 RepID=UPI00101D3488|nr:DUF6241 domain-containing protein [Ectobacillus funiculus]